ncbi:hypothetical protein QAD02_015788 [Eretmocerus hayati]|uniref:Uncharacterized protein n=1 Tax=Eretmocerus hayati TaxID=131215 RepID=A0ACC2P980_9HYME|nr:hypothetical protein QAD02_015788 [Eretmocerus hayati]
MLSVDGASAELWNRDGTVKMPLAAEKNNLRTEKPVPRPECKVGTEYKYYCNTCYCSEDGTTSRCTEMSCDKTMWNQDGTLKINPGDKQGSRMFTRTGKPCEPGTSFQRDCNTCWCPPNVHMYLKSFKSIGSDQDYNKIDTKKPTSLHFAVRHL